MCPALLRFETSGLVDAEWKPTESNRRARYYCLTRSSRKHLSIEDRWRDHAAAIAAFLAFTRGRFRGYVTNLPLMQKIIPRRFAPMAQRRLIHDHRTTPSVSRQCAQRRWSSFFGSICFLSPPHCRRLRTLCDQGKPAIGEIARSDKRTRALASEQIRNDLQVIARWREPYRMRLFRAKY